MDANTLTLTLYEIEPDTEQLFGFREGENLWLEDGVIAFDKEEVMERKEVNGKVFVLLNDTSQWSEADTESYCKRCDLMMSPEYDGHPDRQEGYDCEGNWRCKQCRGPDPAWKLLLQLQALDKDEIVAGKHDDLLKKYMGLKLDEFAKVRALNKDDIRAGKHDDLLKEYIGSQLDEITGEVKK